MNPTPEWLIQRAYLSPERLALDDGHLRLNYRELAVRVDDLAARLASLGITGGTVTALLMQNSTRFALFVHALRRLGAVMVPLNLRLTPAEIAWQIGDSAAQTLIYDSAYTDIAATIGQSDLQTIESGAVFTLPPVDVALNPILNLDALNCIIYTSGTTGQPKGALLTHGNLWWSAVGSALNLGLRDDDVWLACLPLFHVGGLSILIRAVIYGVPALIHERFDAAAVNAAIRTQNVTHISVVATMLQRMLEDPAPFPATLRCVLLGGGPAPLPLLEQCAARAIPVVQTYGMSETASQVVTLAPEDALRKLGSAGKPLFPNQVKILDPDAEGAGEIAVQGPSIFMGYLNRPVESGAALQDGWLHTGDIGKFDSDGYLYILDRRKDLIISGGENIYPAEIESVLAGHPAVEEAGVFALPSEQWGQVPGAVVKCRTGMSATEQALQTYCSEWLARFKRPARIFFTEQPLPRNAAGKLLRRKLSDFMNSA
jgi:O-succinylbenzoic acid--CoA ligase